jgi:hypothetical protein
LRPKPGPQLVGNLRELANIGRSVAGHGREHDLKAVQTSAWIVEVAALYEWIQVATPLGARLRYPTEEEPEPDWESAQLCKRCGLVAQFYKDDG